VLTYAYRCKSRQNTNILTCTYKEVTNVQKSCGQLLWKDALTLWVKVGTEQFWYENNAPFHARCEHKNLVNQSQAHWAMGNKTLCSPLPFIFCHWSTLLCINISSICFMWWVELIHRTLCATTVFWQALEDSDSVIRNTLLSSRYSTNHYPLINM